MLKGGALRQRLFNHFSFCEIPAAICSIHKWIEESPHLLSGDGGEIKKCLSFILSTQFFGNSTIIYYDIGKLYHLPSNQIEF